jgi:FdhD protein
MFISTKYLYSLFKTFSIKGNYCYVETERTPVWCRKTVFSGCGSMVYAPMIRKNIFDSFRISAERIFMLMKEFQKLAMVYKRTGGVHCAGISDGEKIISFHEDIGRHNAFDKVVGECLAKGISMARKIILSSGRISSEIVLKSAVVGIPVIVSRAAPTTYAIKLAKLYSITIVGFARGRRMNIYSHTRRIV